MNVKIPATVIQARRHEKIKTKMIQKIKNKKYGPHPDYYDSQGMDSGYGWKTGHGQIH